MTRSVCRHCGTVIVRDALGAWLDETDGDGCDPTVHEPVVASEYLADILDEALDDIRAGSTRAMMDRLPVVEIERVVSLLRRPTTMSEDEILGHAEARANMHPCAVCDVLVSSDHAAEWQCHAPGCGVWYYAEDDDAPACPECGAPRAVFRGRGPVNG